MAGTSLLALIDDIATLLDDIALMSKVAAKKTAGVLGDDLALNAQQVTGVSAEREIPVVWAVAKGSLLNKAILVPAAILISIFIPWAITPLLMCGGAFLCFEGAEKLAHKFLHNNPEHHQEKLRAIKNKDVDMVEFEKNKVKGAIRTDFILSAEIITITLGIVAEAAIGTQIAVLAIIAVVITLSVYGLVGALVKIDDLGLYLFNAENASAFKKKTGLALLNAAPKLMKFLSIAGTIAMFLVGGGIIAHGIPAVHHLIAHTEEIISQSSAAISWSAHLIAALGNGLFGLLIGIVLVILMQLIQKIRSEKNIK
jgi:predicted DNA repair protein MutK